MNNNPLAGVFTALVTPFQTGSVDQQSFVRLVKDQLRQGVQGFVINGTTGESPNLSFAEIELLYRLARKEVGPTFPVIVGTGSNSTRQTIEMTVAVSEWKPQAVLVVVPYYNKPPQRGLVEHFRAVAEAKGPPVLVYNVPSRTVADLGDETLIELAQHPNIIGLKDATGDIRRLQFMRQRVPKGFVLLSGDDATSVEFVAKGGDGVIGVTTHLIGRQTRDLFELVKRDGQRAIDEYKQHFGELARLLFIEANPIPVKMALQWRGLIQSAEVRLPLVELAENYQKELKKCLESLSSK